MGENPYSSNGKPVLQNSIFYRAIGKYPSLLIDSTMKIAGFIKKMCLRFCDTQTTGLIVISAILANLLLIDIMQMEVKPEWIVYRCIIAITFLPWILCKADLRKIAKGSKFLKIFYKHG